MRVLQIMTSLSGGGVARIAFDYCSRIHGVDFDFSICPPNVGILEQPAKELGYGVYRFQPMRNGVFKSLSQQRRNIRQKHYDAVYSHLAYKAFIALAFAWAGGVKIRVAHAHMAFVPETFFQKAVRRICTALTKLFATQLVACGHDAAEWVWGKRAVAKNKVWVINNAIDSEAFKFRPDKRSAKRAELGIDGRFAVGLVARFCDEKNHRFLVDEWKEVIRRRPDAVMVFVGDGGLMEATRKAVSDAGLDGSVLFLGVRSDVCELLNALDMFVLPSLYEGLPFRS